MTDVTVLADVIDVTGSRRTYCSRRESLFPHCDKPLPYPVFSQDILLAYDTPREPAKPKAKGDWEIEVASLRSTPPACFHTLPMLRLLYSYIRPLSALPQSSLSHHSVVIQSSLSHHSVITQSSLSHHSVITQRLGYPITATHFARRPPHAAGGRPRRAKASGDARPRPEDVTGRGGAREPALHAGAAAAAHDK